MYPILKTVFFTHILQILPIQFKYYIHSITEYQFSPSYVLFNGSTKMFLNSSILLCVFLIFKTNIKYWFVMLFLRKLLELIWNPYREDILNMWVFERIVSIFSASRIYRKRRDKVYKVRRTLTEIWRRHVDGLVMAHGKHLVLNENIILSLLFYSVRN